MTSRGRRPRADEETGELNIVPYLDILVNLIMFLLVTQATLVSLGVVDVTAHGYAPPGPRPSMAPEALRLTVGIARSGFFIAAKGGVLKGEGDGAPAIPKRDGAYDYGALARKLRAIKAAIPSASALYLAADEDVPYEVIVRTLDAARSDAAGPLFPAVAFSQLD